MLFKMNLKTNGAVFVYFFKQVLKLNYYPFLKQRLTAVR